jgi:thioredoxin reductase (NADPH)
VHELHPRAKRLLLVPWWDRRSAPAILTGCALGRLDNYLHRPWVPAEVYLYPPVSEILAEWTRAARPGLELVRVIGHRRSARVHELDELLERNGIPHGLYEADSPEGQRLLALADADGSRLPALLLLDGRALVVPTNAEIADALGASTRHDRSCDLLIVGAGPAGLAAAVYAASEGLNTLVLEREALGGQAGTSSLIRNYLGFPRGISGADLAQRAYEQAWLFGAKYVLVREATALRAEGTKRVVTLSDGRDIEARAVLIATGATYRRLGIPSLERFVGEGVYYTALGDPHLLAGEHLYVAGGGNSAGQAVAHYARGAQHVTLLVRGKALHQAMSDYLVREIRELPNVDVRLQTEVVAGGGDGRLESLTLHDRTRDLTETVPASMLFVLIGALPHTDWLAGTVARDRHGFILTGRDLPGDEGAARERIRFETSVPGVFAIGDVRSASVKRVASAVGEGSAAAYSVHEYLKAPVDLGSARADLRPPPPRGDAAPSPEAREAR